MKIRFPQQRKHSRRSSKLGRTCRFEPLEPRQLLSTAPQTLVLPDAPAALSVGSQVKSVDNSVFYQGEGGNIPLANVGAASQLTPSKTANASPSWSTPIAILQDNNLNDSGGATIVIDQSGQWNVVYGDENSNNPIDTSINYLHQGAAAPVTIAEGKLINQNGTPTGTYVYCPSIAINAAGGLYVTYIQQTYAGTGMTYINTSLMYTDDLPQSKSTTDLSISPTSSVFGQTLNGEVTVRAVGNASEIPTGTVTLMDGTKALLTLNLSTTGLDAFADFSISGLSVGTHSIKAVYSGDNNFSTNTSSVVTEVVKKANSAVKVASSVNPSTPGENIAFTATVNASSSGAGTPTGIVTFKDGTKTLGTATLSSVNGVMTATFSISGLAVGSHKITAVYGGDGNFNGSTSPAVTQTVAKAAKSVAKAAKSVAPSVHDLALLSLIGGGSRYSEEMA
ncbi:MAG: Ig-like domain-containing protein [Thermoguttaceae bacterium]